MARANGSPAIRLSDYPAPARTPATGLVNYDVRGGRSCRSSREILRYPTHPANTTKTLGNDTGNTVEYHFRRMEGRSLPPWPESIPVRVHASGGWFFEGRQRPRTHTGLPRTPALVQVLQAWSGARADGAVGPPPATQPHRVRLGAGDVAVAQRNLETILA